MSSVRMSEEHQRPLNPSEIAGKIISLDENPEAGDEFYNSVDAFVSQYQDDLSGSIALDEKVVVKLFRSIFYRIELLASKQDATTSGKGLYQLLLAAKIVLRSQYSAPCIADEIITTLSELAGIYHPVRTAAEVGRDFSLHLREHYDISMESLKCLYNAIHIMRMHSELSLSKWIPYLLCVLKFNLFDMDQLPSLLLGKILFYLHFSHPEEATDDLYSFSENVLHEIACRDNSFIDVNFERLIEYLRTLHLFGLRVVSKNTNESERVSLMTMSAKALVNLDRHPQDLKYERLFREVVNFLQAADFESYCPDTVSGFAHAVLNYVVYTLNSYSRNPPKVNDAVELDLVLCPLFHVVGRIIKEVPGAIDVYKSRLMLDEKNKHLTSVFISIMSPYRNEKYQLVVGNTLYILCDMNRSSMIELLGFNHAAGYLQAISNLPV